MRFVFSSHVTRVLKNSCALAALAALSTACSSDFSRIEAYDYASAIKPPEQQAYADPQAQNPYPANVDPVTTASVNTRSTYQRPPTPSGYVSNQQPSTPQYAQYRPSQPAPTPPVTQNYNTYNTYNTYQTPPKPSLSAARRTTSVDPVVTSSVVKPTPTIQRQPLPLAKKTVAAVQPKPVAAARTVETTTRTVEVTSANVTPQQAGWTATGGTRITVRDGETLYNISKRYGVPVSALMRVNGIANADQVNAGQQITVPTYVYSSKLGVSAPDNDTKTRASRASTGYFGEVTNSNIAIPTPKPVTGYKPGLAPMTPSLAQTTTGAFAHKVVSGDSLGKIAAQNNTTVAKLMQVNNLTSSNIRIGQTLKLPSASQVAQSTTARLPIKPGLAPISTDRVVTGSTKTEEAKPKPYVKPGLAPQRVANLNEEAPSRSGIDTFRWPVTGKVISKFGDKRGDNRNDGIDISVPEGTSVKAAENGLVIYSGTELQEYGKLILVRHEGGWVSAYAHNKSLLVKRGAKIKRGDVIAHSGRTGNAKIPMLHFELRKDSNPVNPQQFLR